MINAKYRGLRTDGKGWVYGNLINWHPKLNPRIIWFEECEINEFKETNSEVIPETVGQYITSNGKQDFYIGDIAVNPQGRRHTVVIFDNIPCLHYKVKGRDFYSPMSSGYLHNKTVIGNIHEKGGENEKQS